MQPRPKKGSGEKPGDAGLRASRKREKAVPRGIFKQSVGHVMHCTTCNLPEDVEPHTYDRTGTCTLCGYYAGTCTVTFDPDNWGGNGEGTR